MRSQDKETLIKCEKILVEKGKDSFALLNYIDTKNWFRLGLYKTEERALEVLDEIENALLNRWADNVKYEQHYGDERPSSLVYEMPKE